MFDFIERVVYINLEHRTDRKNDIELELSKSSGCLRLKIGLDLVMEIELLLRKGLVEVLGI